MKDKQVHILCTRLLDRSLIEKAAEHSIIIDELPFIKTAPIINEETSNKINEIAATPQVVAFSSANAVESVAASLHSQPEWIVYCVGKQTARLVSTNLPHCTVAA